MSTVKELSPKEFRKMQLMQLEMISELDRVCRENNIKYSLVGGTLLGAVRHKGYIPWDDDADVSMLREEYEKFKKVAYQMNHEICYFQDNTTDPYYRWGYGKLRRTGTTYIRVGQEHLKCKTGVFVDVFPLDDASLTLPGQMIQDFLCFCLRKILWSEVAKVNEKGIKKIWYHLLSKIPTDIVWKLEHKYIKKSKNTSPNRVRSLLFPSVGKGHKNKGVARYSMPKEWFLDLGEYEFEGKKFYGIKNYDEYLRYEYGDYMVLPPEDQRVVHAPVSDYSF